MPRAKKQEPVPGIGHNQPPSERASTPVSTVNEIVNPTPDKLIAEYIANRNWMAAEAKRFQEHMQPFRDRMTAIENQLLEKLNAENTNSISTEAGTAFKSVKTTPKIVDREKYLDFVLDNWDAVGNELLQIGAPQIEAFKTYKEKREGEIKAFMDANGGALPADVQVSPPGTEYSLFTTVNIRKA